LIFYFQMENSSITRADTQQYDENILLDRCRTAKTPAEQKQSFTDLAVFLEHFQSKDKIARAVDNNNPSSTSYSLSPSSISAVKILAARENISRSVLITWPYAQVSTDIDRILDACGQVVAISTCSGLLKDIAATNCNDDKVSRISLSSLPLQSVIQACWSTIQRMLLSEKSIRWDDEINERNIEDELNKSDSVPMIVPLDNSNDDGDQAKSLEWKRFVTGIVILLPQTLANACHAVKLQIPLHGTPGYFYQRLVYFAWVQTRISSNTLCTSWYLNSLIIQLLQTRRSEYVVRGLMRSANKMNRYNTKGIPSFNDDDDKIASLTTFLIALKLLPRDMATLILALIQYANVRGQVDKTDTLSIHDWRHGKVRVICNSLFGYSSIEHQEAIIEQLVFSKFSSSGYKNDQRYWSLWVIEIISQSTVSFSEHLANIAERWSQWTFVQEVEGRQQHHVSLVLWQGLVHLMSFSSSSSLQDLTQRELIMSLVNGVSHRLSSTVVTIRQDGMRIAQLLAKGLGQDIQFDEYISDEQEEEEVDDYYDIDIMKGNGSKKKIKSKQKNHRLTDPDADYDSDEEIDREDGEPKINREVNADDDDDDDLSVEFENDLIPYALEDDEDDLRETPRPLHLIDALELLRTGENHDHAYSRHEAALDTLPSLIRSRPDNLKDVAVSLVLQLLRMEDKFNIHQFNAKRETAIRALVLDEPILVGQVLITQLFEEGGLSDRLCILAVLQSAALQLSGNQFVSQSAQNYDEPTSMKTILIDHKGDSVSHLNQTTRVISKTRRKRSRNQQKAIKNHFSNTASMWFYSLIAGFIKHKEDETLWTGSTGSILLSYYFRCLATIVEFAGIQASQVLANDLLDIVWDFRTADVAEVRLSVLVAASTSIAMLSDEKLISIIYDEASLPRIMLDMSKRDPDEECRSICKTISYSLHEVLNSNSNC